LATEPCPFDPSALLEKSSASKTTRLIEWNCDVLLRLLKQVVARRETQGQANSNDKPADESRFMMDSISNGKIVIDEVMEIIKLPKFNEKFLAVDPDEIHLKAEVVDQLFDYVSNISSMYNNNPFHNFEHASHVTMSVVKLLSRIVAPSDVDSGDGKSLVR
jgi:hypothetical protein